MYKCHTRHVVLPAFVTALKGFTFQKMSREDYQTYNRLGRRSETIQLTFYLYSNIVEPKINLGRKPAL